MYPAKPIAASKASKIMLFILSFRCSNGDGHSQWLSPFSFAALQTMRRAKLICESPSCATRIKQTKQTTIRLGHVLQRVLARAEMVLRYPLRPAACRSISIHQFANGCTRIWPSSRPTQTGMLYGEASDIKVAR